MTITIPIIAFLVVSIIFQYFKIRDQQREIDGLKQKEEEYISRNSSIARDRLKYLETFFMLRKENDSLRSQIKHIESKFWIKRK